MSLSHFPAPRVPPHPVLDWADVRRANGQAFSPQNGHMLWLRSGRMAIAAAMRCMHVKAGDRVLMPAYHCIAMVEPVCGAGAEPIFYQIHKDGSVNLDDVVAKLDDRVRAMLAVHYFGFPQDMAPIRAWCDQHGIFLLEDCAHAWFGAGLGRYGDYAIASPWKFLPVYDGGCLMSTRHDVAVAVADPGVAAQLKTLVNTLEEAFAYGRLKGLSWFVRPVLRLKDALLCRLKGRVSGQPLAQSPTGVVYDAGVKQPMSALSRWLMARADGARLAEMRRQHYQTWLNAVADVPGCQALHPVLPEAVVPYVFPLLLDEPERVFPLLKAQGVPIIRFGEFLWPGVDAALCPNSADLSRRLFQFPCHQGLRPGELAWMITRLRQVLAQP